jgi:heme exporter protein D
MIPDLGKYAGTVLSAYAATILLVLALVALSWVQSHRSKARLAGVEARKGADHG